MPGKGSHINGKEWSHIGFPWPRSTGSNEIEPGAICVPGRKRGTLVYNLKVSGGKGPALWIKICQAFYYKTLLKKETSSLLQWFNFSKSLWDCRGIIQIKRYCLVLSVLKHFIFIPPFMSIVQKAVCECKLKRELKQPYYRSRIEKIINVVVHGTWEVTTFQLLQGFTGL